jgi:hypothetical protein
MPINAINAPRCPTPALQRHDTDQRLSHFPDVHLSREQAIGPGIPGSSLAACRAFNVRCVARVGGWMQGAARRQWLFHCQASQRSRRRPPAQPEGPDGLLATKSQKWNREIHVNSNFDRSREPKGLPAHSRGKPDRLLGSVTRTAQRTQAYVGFALIWIIRGPFSARLPRWARRHVEYCRAIGQGIRPAWIWTS